MRTRGTEAWMWAEACRMLERAESLHRQFFHPGPMGARRTSWEPPVDLFETERELWILVALPGVEPDRVEVVVEADSLTVVGERALPAPFRRAAVRRLEIPYGRFERRIRLPSMPLEVDRRELRHGCLVLSLRKLR